MKKSRIMIWSGCIVVVLCITILLLCNQLVVSNAEGKVFSDIDSIKYNKVGLLLGTTPQSRIDRVKLFLYLSHRCSRAVI